jgi:hypothetical protein
MVMPLVCFVVCAGGGAGAAEEPAQRAQQDAAQGLQR